jgi:hypothetical protein
MTEILILAALCIVGPPLMLFLLGLAIVTLIAITDKLSGL